MDDEPSRPKLIRLPCERRNFAGEFPQGTCSDCGHLIIAHVGCESCVICRLELLAAQLEARGR